MTIVKYKGSAQKEEKREKPVNGRIFIGEKGVGADTSKTPKPPPPNANENLQATEV